MNVAFACGLNYATCTYVQETLAGKLMRAPFTGTITRFRIEGGFGGEATYRLLVLRSRGDGRYKGIRQTGKKTANVAAPEVASFRANLPIRKGDFIGISLSGSQAEVGGTTTEAEAAPYYCKFGFGPALPVGTTSQPTPDFSECGYLVLYNAKLVR